MMPVTGGYYQWVKKALGIRFAFYEGWWTWLYTFVDLAIYPVLFTQYALFFFPAAAVYKIPICLAIIWTGALLNIRGIVPVGKTSVILTFVVLIPFLLLFIKAVFATHGTVVLPSLSLKGVGFPSMGMAIYTVMWNFIGWDNASTYAEEVDQPVKTYIISTLIAFISIFVIYFLAILTAQYSGIDPAFLRDNGFPALGVQLAGRWLGVLFAIGGMASSIGIFFAVLLSVSRVPKVMADDQLLPAKLQLEHRRHNTPYISILICASIVSCMVFFSFADLIFIDVTLYGAGLLLEFVSLLVFRIRKPHAHRPFKIPLGKLGILVMITFPLGVLAVALTASCMANAQSSPPLLFTLAALASAEVAWQLIKLNRKIFRKLPLPAQSIVSSFEEEKAQKDSIL